MEKDIENRFDEKRPFDVIRAEDFGGDLFEFYEPLEKLVRKVSGVDIVGSRPVFLIGGRGTGKTMVLRFLSFEMQIKDFLKKDEGKKKPIDMLEESEIQEFLARKRFIGIYLRFKTTEYDSMKGEAAKLFKPYFSLKLAEQLFRFLKILKSSGIMSSEKEEQIVEFFAEQVKEPKLRLETSLNGALASIKEQLFPLFETILEKYSYCSFEEIKKDHNIPVIVSKKILFDLPKLVFAEIGYLRGKNLFILLDELEYLNDYQTCCIGELIKDSDETPVIFKIGSRYMPEKVPVGGSNEVLQEPHDFRIINITDALNAAHGGNRTDYGDLIKHILKKRLGRSEFFRNRGITDAEQLFPNIPLEKEALDLVDNREKHWKKFRSYLKQPGLEEKIDEIIDNLKCPTNPIIEKLNMLLFFRGNSSQKIKIMCEEYLNGKNEKYGHLYSKNALNLLFQLYNDYRKEKVYAGLDVFVHLSSGIIRNAIELCNQALTTAYNFNYERSTKELVETVYQDIGAKHCARLQYDDIPRVPGNVGLEIQDFINQIGAIFRALHLDPYMIEPEPTHFETHYSKLKDRAKQIIDAALKYSYLQEKPPMHPKKQAETLRRDFIVNRIFAPYFQISYNVRGRTLISPSQIHVLVTGSISEKNQIRNVIIKQNSRRKGATAREAGIQSTLFDIG